MSRPLDTSPKAFINSTAFPAVLHAQTAVAAIMATATTATAAIAMPGLAMARIRILAWVEACATEAAQPVPTRPRRDAAGYSKRASARPECSGDNATAAAGTVAAATAVAAADNATRRDCRGAPAWRRTCVWHDCGCGWLRFCTTKIYYLLDLIEPGEVQRTYEMICAKRRRLVIFSGHAHPHGLAHTCVCACTSARVCTALRCR